MVTAFTTSEHGSELRSNCENYNKWYYLITIKPNWKSLIKKVKENKQVLLDIFQKWMIENKFHQIDSNIEYDSKNVPHIHLAVVSNDKLSKCDIISPKGCYVDIREFEIDDIDKVINYINKVDKTTDISYYFENNYGFIN